MYLLLEFTITLTGLGSVSLDECVSPVVNIVFGITASVIAILCSFTIFFSISQKSSFLRAQRIVTPISLKCKMTISNINKIKSTILREKVEEIDAKVIDDIGSNSFTDKAMRILKCIVFFFGSLLVSAVASFTIYFLLLFSIFYGTFILWVSQSIIITYL